MKAASGARRWYDWRRGHRFSTYATWWIRHAVRRAIANKSRLLRLHVSLLERERELARVEADLAGTLRRSPTDQELATASHLTAAEVEKVRAAPRSVISLERRAGAEEEAAR